MITSKAIVVWKFRKFDNFDQNFPKKLIFDGILKNYENSFLCRLGFRSRMRTPGTFLESLGPKFCEKWKNRFFIELWPWGCLDEFFDFWPFQPAPGCEGLQKWPNRANLIKKFYFRKIWFLSFLMTYRACLCDN